MNIAKNRPKWVPTLFQFVLKKVLRRVRDVKELSKVDWDQETVKYWPQFHAEHAKPPGPKKPKKEAKAASAGESDDDDGSSSSSTVDTFDGASARDIVSSLAESLDRMMGGGGTTTTPTSDTLLSSSGLYSADSATVSGSGFTVTPHTEPPSKPPRKLPGGGLAKAAAAAPPACQAPAIVGGGDRNAAAYEQQALSAADAISSWLPGMPAVAVERLRKDAGVEAVRTFAQGGSRLALPAARNIAGANANAAITPAQTTSLARGAVARADELSHVFRGEARAVGLGDNHRLALTFDELHLLTKEVATTLAVAAAHSGDGSSALLATPHCALPPPERDAQPPRQQPLDNMRAPGQGQKMEAHGPRAWITRDGVIIRDVVTGEDSADIDLDSVGNWKL
jgi:hypothetical protein